MARPVLTFDEFRPRQPAGAQPTAATRQRPVLTFEEYRPKALSDDGKVMGSIVEGLASTRLQRERAAVEERNRLRSEQAAALNLERDSGVGSFGPGPDLPEVFDEEGWRARLRTEADQAVAGAATKINWRQLDPVGIMGETAKEKLAARFKAATGDPSDLKAYDYDATGTAYGLFGQYDPADLIAARDKAREAFPEYGKDVDPDGLHPSRVLEKLRREKYPDLTYEEMMAGFGAKSRAERGQTAVMTDAEAPQATYAEALTENFRAALPRLAADFQVLAADITGDDAARQEAFKLRDTIQGSVADANRGNDGNVLKAAGLAVAGSAPELAATVATGGLVGTGTRGVLGYRAMRAGAALDAAATAKTIASARNIGSQATLAATVFPAAFADNRAGGYSIAESAVNAVGKVAIEAISESGFFEAASRGASSWRDVMRNWGDAIKGEAAGETFAAAVEPLWDSGSLGKSMPTVEEYAKNIATGALAGLGLGASVGSISAGRQAAEVWRTQGFDTRTASARELAQRLAGSGTLPPEAQPASPAAPAPAPPTAPQAAPAGPPAGPGASSTPTPTPPSAPAQAAAAAAVQPSAPAAAAPAAPVDPAVQARTLRESKAREDFQARIAQAEQDGTPLTPAAREALATEIATDYQVMRAKVYRPSKASRAAAPAQPPTPTQGVPDVADAGVQPQPQPGRAEPQPGSVDARGVPAGGDAARPDVPGGRGAVGPADTGVAGRRTDVGGDAAPAAAAANPEVRPDQPTAPVTPATPAARTVKIGEQTFPVPAENVAALDEAEARYREGMARAKAMRDQPQPQDGTADPDMGAKTAKERFAAESKRLGMERAAARRQAVGPAALTPKENAKAEAQAAVIRVGDSVTLPDGTPAMVTKTGGFNRLTVQRADGATDIVPRSSLTKTAPAPAAPAAAPAEPAAPAADVGARADAWAAKLDAMSDTEVDDLVARGVAKDAFATKASRLQRATATEKRDLLKRSEHPDDLDNAAAVPPAEESPQRPLFSQVRRAPADDGGATGTGSPPAPQGQRLIPEVEAEFLSPDQRDEVVSTEAQRDGETVNIRVKAGLFANILAKRCNTVGSLLDCLRS